MGNEPREGSCFTDREVRGSGKWWHKEGFLYQWNSTWGSLDHEVSRAEALVIYDPSLLAAGGSVNRLCLSLFFLKDFIYLFLERGEGREKKRERNIDVREKPQPVASCTPGHML